MNVSSVVQVVLFGVQLLVTIIGNFFLLVLLWRSKQTRRRASMNFIFNCALADFTSAVINIPLAMDYMIFKSGRLNGTVASAVVSSMISFLIPLTLHSTLMIMADRLLIVKCPVKYNNKMNVKKARTAIVMMWLTTLIFTGIVYTSQIINNPPRVGENPVEFMKRFLLEGDDALRVFFPACAIFLSSAALTTMFYRKLRKLLKAKINPTADDSETLKAMGQRQLIASSSRTALIVMATCLVSCFPGLLDSIFRFLQVALPIDDSVQASVVLFFFQMSSSMNPYVFILRSSVLRQAAVKMITNRQKITVVPVVVPIE